MKHTLSFPVLGLLLLLAGSVSAYQALRASAVNDSAHVRAIPGGSGALAISNGSSFPRQGEFRTNVLSNNPNIAGAGVWGYGGDPTQTYNSGRGVYLQWPGWGSWTGWGGDIMDDQYYYDATRTFYGIADYTGDPQWTTLARRALTQAYLPFIEQSDPPKFAMNPPHANIQAWLILPWGVYLDWQRNPDPTAKARARKVLFALANNQNFGVTTPMSFIPDLFTAREVAYNLTAKFLAIKAGYVAAQGGLMWGMTEDTLIGQAFLYVDQAIGLLQGGDGGVSDPNHRYVRPFMMANLAEALILLYEYNGDSRVIPKLSQLFDLLWTVCYRANGVTLSNALPDGTTPAPRRNYTYGYNSMTYTDRLSAGTNDPNILGASPNDPTQWVYNSSVGQWVLPATSALWPTPELNGLMIPAYYWLYQRTGDTKWRDRADLLFDGMVRVSHSGSVWGTDVSQCYFNRGKVFNQMYSRIWNYVLTR